MSRPRHLVVVLGTATEIGKTWVTVALTEHLIGLGLAVAARKPAQSYAPDEVTRTDADLLARATGVEPTTVCPGERWYPTPMAPPMAADALGRPRIGLDDLVSELAWPDPGPDVGLVETAGGPASPLAHDGDGIDLARRLTADQTVLVADAGLGTINAVRLAAAGLTARGVAAPTVHLNRFRPSDDLHGRNRDWLVADGFAVTTGIAELAATIGPRVVA
jgi:dethiobiotin synthetase